MKSDYTKKSRREGKIIVSPDFLEINNEKPKLTLNSDYFEATECRNCLKEIDILNCYIKIVGGTLYEMCSLQCFYESYGDIDKNKLHK